MMAAGEKPGTMLRATGKVETMSSKAVKGARLRREGVDPPTTSGDGTQADGDAMARACCTRAQADGLDGAAASTARTRTSLSRTLSFCGLCGAAGPRWQAA